MISFFKTVLLAGMATIIGLAPVSAGGFNDAQKAEINEMIQNYLLDHPEAVQEALDALEAKKQEAQQQAMAGAIDEMKDKLFDSKRQVILGNPDAPISLVEFFDYNCGYCKRALPDTLAMLENDKDVKIVLKEFPILGPGSVEVAKVAVALNIIAPEKYLDFHVAMLKSKGEANDAQAMKVIDALGIDEATIRKAMKDPEVNKTLEEVYTMANKLGLSGTPTYVISNEVVFGAVGVDDLRTKIAAVRECGKATC